MSSSTIYLGSRHKVVRKAYRGAPRVDGRRMQRLCPVKHYEEVLDWENRYTKPASPSTWRAKSQGEETRGESEDGW